MSQDFVSDDDNLNPTVSP